jgi:hypothetical protein
MLVRLVFDNMFSELRYQKERAAHHHEQRPTEETLVGVLGTESFLRPEERREISRGDLLDATTESLTDAKSMQMSE